MLCYTVSSSIHTAEHYYSCLSVYVCACVLYEFVVAKKLVFWNDPRSSVTVTLGNQVYGKDPGKAWHKHMQAGIQMDARPVHCA